MSPTFVLFFFFFFYKRIREIIERIESTTSRYSILYVQKYRENIEEMNSTSFILQKFREIIIYAGTRMQMNLPSEVFLILANIP